MAPSGRRWDTNQSVQGAKKKSVRSENPSPLTKAEKSAEHEVFNARCRRRTNRVPQSNGSQEIPRVFIAPGLDLDVISEMPLLQGLRKVFRHVERR